MAIAASLKDIPQLQTLNLWNNSIGDAGAKAIAASLKDERFFLVSCRVG